MRITKVEQWLKANLSTLAIIIICVAYIFYGVAQIKETGATVEEIIASGVISFFIGFSIKCLMGNQGIADGELSKEYQETNSFYCSCLEEISPYQEYLQTFCDMENKEDLKKLQLSILRKCSLQSKYDDIINDRIDIKKLPKEKRKCIMKMLKATIVEISESILLSDMHYNKTINNELASNIKEHQAKRGLRNALVMLLCAFIFGYYKLGDEYDFSGVLWNSIQIASYLLFGALEYISSYGYMVRDYRTKIIRKTNYLEKFRNMYKKNPSMFMPNKENVVDIKVGVVDELSENESISN